MDATVAVIAGALASGIGVLLVQWIKQAYRMVTQAELGGKPALWVTVAVSAVLGCVAVWIAGGFSPPWPVAWADWIVRIGGIIALIFSAMTLIYKQIISPPAPAGKV